VSSNLGERKNRRMIASSTTAPNTSDPTMPAASPGISGRGGVRCAVARAGAGAADTGIDFDTLTDTGSLAGNDSSMPWSIASSCGISVTARAGGVPPLCAGGAE